MNQIKKIKKKNKQKERTFTKTKKTITDSVELDFRNFKDFF